MYALVTGATSGIGKEISKILAYKNYNLILVGRRMDRLKYMKKYFNKKYGINVVIRNYDLSRRENCFRLFNDCMPYNVRVLVNSAGFGKVGYVVDTNVNDDVDMINTNVTAVHILTKLFAKHMKNGNIINISSIAGFFPGPFMTEYGATKSYVLNFSLAMNYELKKLKKDVHITTVCPGPVLTEFDKVAGSNFPISYITAKECAIQAVNGMMANKTLVLPTNLVKFLVKASKIMPYKIVLPVEHYLQKKKIK